jgi:nicotinamidase-related amidase
MDTMPYVRSPDLMQPEDSALIVVDVQEKLAPAVANHQRVVWNVRRLLEAAKSLEVPALATEQYPAGLGATVASLAGYFPEIPDKLTFSCVGCPEFHRRLADLRRRHLVVAGMETHVCVQQTVLDLLAEGFRVYVAVDAAGARAALDHDTALRRMETSGAILTTVEAVLFEWCVAAGTDAFRSIRKLVMEEPPT